MNEKKAQMTSESKALTNSLFLQDFNIPVIEDVAGSCSASSTEFAVNQQLLLLHQSIGFARPHCRNHHSFPCFLS